MMRNLLLTIIFITTHFILISQNYEGYFNFEFEETTGKLLFKVDKLDQDLLMVNAFGTGLGSNDLGMDRGKLADIKVVKFEKHGDKILLVQSNLNFRAVSDNPLEVSAVEEAFAKSVIFGFKIEKPKKVSIPLIWLPCCTRT
ncbi:MAG: DUF5117 domain-containing protein [Saprospiraceae bacterium]|nr:DUF5117 domain-containing protein [Saprospiraceae bacterium]